MVFGIPTTATFNPLLRTSYSSSNLYHSSILFQIEDIKRKNTWIDWGHLINGICTFLCSITSDDIHLLKKLFCLFYRLFTRKTILVQLKMITYLVDATILNTVHNLGCVMSTTRSSKDSSSTFMNVIDDFGV